jgi:hypothetical protein
MGLAIALWSLRLWYRPASLRPNSLMYRYIYFRWYAWRRGEQKDTVSLTNEQIRHYAVRGVAVGIVLVMVAAMTMVG